MMARVTDVAKVTVAGYRQCNFFQKGANIASAMEHLYPGRVRAEIVEFEDRSAYMAWLPKGRKKLKGGKLLDAHTTCPIVWANDQFYVGGCDEFMQFCRKNLTAGNGSVNTNVTTGSEFPAIADNQQPESNHGFDYDFVVIGGGSGGLQCAKRAAELTGADSASNSGGGSSLSSSSSSSSSSAAAPSSAAAATTTTTQPFKVALFDYVEPSPQGTKWGIGGTCVNVGCIPKKLFHHASLLGDGFMDAASFGWNASISASAAIPDEDGESQSGAMHSQQQQQQQHPAPASASAPALRGANQQAEGSEDGSPKVDKSIDWQILRQGINNHIRSLNFGYRVQLRKKGVEYINKRATFADQHTLNVTDSSGKTEQVTARRILIAVGGRPTPLDCPGGELAITSDDVFWKQTPPGKTLVVGASYVALECAGFLQGLGYPVTVLVRSILLRGFDQEMAEKIGAHMVSKGVEFKRPAVPLKLEKTPDGKIKATWKLLEEDAEESDVFDTVLTAIGRRPCTDSLGLEKAGVEVISKTGKIPVQYEQTNVPNIYALGDAIDGVMELTPTAIKAGKLLAERLFGNGTKLMQYHNVCTTVFTPLEYGSVGLSEEAAIERFGQADVDAYHAHFTPLEWTVSHKGDNMCYCKVVVRKSDDERVLGLHILGPNAGEVTQGFGTGMNLGMTFEDLRDTVGIHPTVAEEIVRLDILKSSGESSIRSGC